MHRSALICCRRTRISALSRPLERNKLVSVVHSSMRTSTIEMSITRFVPLANRIGFPTRTGSARLVDHGAGQLWKITLNPLHLLRRPTEEDAIRADDVPD
jgi:hypothetical protein